MEFLARPASALRTPSTALAQAPGRANAAPSVAVWTDDVSTLDLLLGQLADEGVTASRMTDVESGKAPDAALLSVTRTLTEQLGRLRSVRARWPLTPLLVACRGARDLDHVLALEMGADDVLDLAWSAPVIAARLRAQWRSTAQRRAALPQLDELNFGSLSVKLRERAVSLAGCTVPLTEGEFELLWLLASHAGSALSRRDILRRVRGLDDHLLDRSVDSRVYRLRAKLGDPLGPTQRIRAVRNRGYVFSPVGW